MKYIEIKSEGYTYRYDFESVPSTNETFNPNIVIPTEDRSSASESLDVCLDLLSSIFGKEEVRKAINKAEILSVLSFLRYSLSEQHSSMPRTSRMSCWKA